MANITKRFQQMQSSALRAIESIIHGEAERIDRVEWVDGAKYRFVAYRQVDGVVRVDIRLDKPKSKSRKAQKE